MGQEVVPGLPAPPSGLEVEVGEVAPGRQGIAIEAPGKARSLAFLGSIGAMLKRDGGKGIPGALWGTVAAWQARKTPVTLVVLDDKLVVDGRDVPLAGATGVRRTKMSVWLDKGGKGEVVFTGRPAHAAWVEALVREVIARGRVPR